MVKETKVVPATLEELKGMRKALNKPEDFVTNDEQRTLALRMLEIQKRIKIKPHQSGGGESTTQSQS